MEVDKHKRLSNITFRHKSTFIAVLHFTITIGSSTMIITHMYVHTRIQGMATANELRVIIIFNIFFIILFYKI